jgi:hypothetical protein
MVNYSNPPKPPEVTFMLTEDLRKYSSVSLNAMTGAAIILRKYSWSFVWRDMTKIRKNRRGSWQSDQMRQIKPPCLNRRGFVGSGKTVKVINKSFKKVRIWKEVSWFF